MLNVICIFDHDLSPECPATIIGLQIRPSVGPLFGDAVTEMRSCIGYLYISLSLEMMTGTISRGPGDVLTMSSYVFWKRF